MSLAVNYAVRDTIIHATGKLEYLGSYAVFWVHITCQTWLALNEVSKQYLFMQNVTVVSRLHRESVQGNILFVRLSRYTDRSHVVYVHTESNQSDYTHKPCKGLLWCITLYTQCTHRSHPAYVHKRSHVADKHTIADTNQKHLREMLLTTFP